MHLRRWPEILFYLVILFVIGLDQLTKAWAITALRPVGMITIVPGFFELTFVRNTGIAFGLFAREGWLVAVFMAGLALVALYYTRELNWRGWEPNLVGGCLVGGALGNLLDRMRHGYVVDFFDFHVGPYHWPSFNVADSLICVSVGWIVLRSSSGRS
jgi:signal peptidase II